MVATLSPRARRIAATALGTGAGALAFSPIAQADTLTDTVGDAVNTINDVTGTITSQEPAPVPSPVESLSIFAQQTFGVVPSNLLRTDSAGTTGSLEAAGTETPALNQAVTTAAIDNYNYKVEAGRQAVAQVQQIAQGFIDPHDGRLDDNTIAQAFGAAQVPTADTLNAISNDINTLVGKINSGEIVNDVQTAINDTLGSPQFVDWQQSTDTIFNIDSSLRGVDRASEGIAQLIDSASTNPVEALNNIVLAAGGPQSLVLDPIGSAARVATAVLGPDMARNFTSLVNDIPGMIINAVRDALPAFLTIPASPIAGALLGAPLGSLIGAGLGKLAGALLGAPLGALPGALLGAIAGAPLTAIPGMIGAALLSIPFALSLPLLSGAAMSTIALVIWATVVFTPWLIYAALTIPVAVFNGLALAGVTVIFAIVLAGFNPVAIPFYLTLLFSLMFPAGFALTILSAWIVTILIPIAIYGLGVLPIAFLSFGAGYLAGLIPALLIPLGSIPVLTALSAIPGTFLGLLPGALLGSALTATLGALLGLPIGAFFGSLAGGMLGALAGTVACTLIAAALGTVIATKDFTDAFSQGASGPLQSFMRAVDNGWQQSRLGHVLGALEYNFFKGTETGRAYGDLLTRVNNLFKQIVFLDGRRLREMLLRGGLLGALIGAIPGALIGHEIGQHLGLFNPLNLLNGLLFGLPWSIPGALIGASLGDLLARAISVVPALASIPLTFPLHYLVLSLPVMALGLPLLLGALAVALIPPLAIAVSVSTLAWLLTQGVFFALPVFLVTAFFTLASIFNTNPLTIAAIGLALFVPLGPSAFFIAPVIATITGAIAAVLATINIFNGAVAALVVGAVVGIPAFWLALPFFVFPALAMSFALVVTAFLLIPAALGASVLDAIKAHFISSLLLSPFFAIPSALLNGLLATIPGTILGTMIAALTRALVYGAVGTGIGAAISASLGFPAGALAALITHTRVGAGIDRADAPTAWLDARILNQGGFGDSLSFIPNLSGTKSMTQLGGMTRVPTVAEPRMGFGSSTGNKNRRIVNSTALVGV